MTPEQIVTIIVGVLQAGGLSLFFAHVIRGLKTQIGALENTIKAQNSTLEVMERRVAETEKVGRIYQELFANLPKDLENYRAVIAATKDAAILELQNSNNQKDDIIKSLRKLEAAASSHPSPETLRQIEAMRFLLSDRQDAFRKFLVAVFDDLEVAVAGIVKCETLKDFFDAHKISIVLEDSKEKWDEYVAAKPPAHMKTASWSGGNWYGVFQNGIVVMSTGQLFAFSDAYKSMAARVKITK